MIDRDQSTLLLIDVQERLLGTIHQWQSLLARLGWLIRAARSLGVPVIASEQYPKGLGPTHATLRSLLAEDTVVEKLHFSCVAAQCFDGMEAAGRKQMVICGIESHVCVLQTAIDYRAAGREVFVVADAVGSRNPVDRDLALARMRHHDIEIVSGEMVLFEWLRRSGTEEFKSISKEFLR